MKKIVIALLTGLALLVLPQTQASAQDCMAPHVVVANAAQAGFDLRTELTGSGLKHFFIVFLETTQGSATPEEIEALTTAIDMIGVFDEQGGGRTVLIIYKDACAINSLGLPRDLVDHVMKQVEQRAINSGGQGV
jgi:hypothetical protein